MNYIATIKKLWKYEGYPNKYPNKLNNYSESLNPGEISQMLYLKKGCDTNPSCEMRNMHVNNTDSVLIEKINTSSVRNEFEMLSHMLKNVISIFMIPETKLDSSYSEPAF